MARLSGAPYTRRAKLLTPGKPETSPDVSLDVLLAGQAPEFLLQALAFGKIKLGLASFSSEALTVLLKHLVVTQKRFAEVRSDIEKRLGIPCQQNGNELASSGKNSAAWRRKLRVLVAYGNKCKCCGEQRPELLVVESVNSTDKRANGQTIYSLIIQNGFQAGYEILCFNCSISRGLYGICPHEIEREWEEPSPEEEVKPVAETEGTA